MNKTIILGRLTRDPELKKTVNGKPYTTFTLAIPRPVAQGMQEQTDFIPVKIWGNSAELAANTLRKGHRVLIDGRIQIDKYEKNGTTLTIFGVVANSFEYIEKKTTEQPSVFDSFGQTVSNQYNGFATTTPSPKKATQQFPGPIPKNFANRTYNQPPISEPVYEEDIEIPF